MEGLAFECTEQKTVMIATTYLKAHRIAERPADTGHPFGHHKAENFSAIAEGSLIVVAAVLILQEAVGALFTTGALADLGPLGLIVNAIAIDSGMICDGAKASCAAKIASAVEAGLLGMQMQMHESQFYGGDGIVVKGVENTIRNIGTLASEGMRETDRTIIRMMIQEH